MTVQGLVVGGANRVGYLKCCQMEEEERIKNDGYGPQSQFLFKEDFTSKNISLTFMDFLSLFKQIFNFYP